MVAETRQNVVDFSVVMRHQNAVSDVEIKLIRKKEKITNFY
jgi:hypothetical protein